VGFTQFFGMPTLTIVLWIVTVVGGPIAAIQPWRFKKSGWAIGLIVFLFGFLNDTVGFVLFPGSRTHHLPSIALNTAFDLLGIILLGLT
jgi:hypothetical protein